MINGLIYVLFPEHVGEEHVKFIIQSLKYADFPPLEKHENYQEERPISNPRDADTRYPHNHNLSRVEEQAYKPLRPKRKDYVPQYTNVRPKGSSQADS